MAHQAAGPLQRISSVATSVEGTRLNELAELKTEFEYSSQWLSNAIEACKKRIIESTISDRDEKKPKFSKIIKVETVDKENSNPNLVQENEDVSSKKMEMVKQENEEEICEDEHPDDDIIISSMKVVELRQELRSRGLDTSGLKKDLQKRLGEAIKAARLERESEKLKQEIVEKNSNEKIDDNLVCPKISIEKEALSLDGKDHDCSESMKEEHLTDTKVSIDSTKSSSCLTVDSKEKATEEESMNDIVMEDNAGDCNNEKDEDVIMDDAEVEDVSTKLNDTSESLHHDYKDTLQDTKNSSDSGQIGDYVSNIENKSGGVQFEDKYKHDAAEKNTEPLKSPEPTKSPKSKNLGRKLLKATSKLFSPSKKKDLSPNKSVRSPLLETKTAENPKKCQKNVSNEPANNKVDYSQIGSVRENQSETKNDKKDKLIHAMSASHIKRAEEKKKIQMALSNSHSNASENDKGSTESSSSASGVVSHVSQPIAHGGSVLKSEPLATPSIKKVSASCSSSQTLQAKKKALAEARKARLAEIRGKSKPVALSQASRNIIATADAEALKKATALTTTNGLGQSSLFKMKTQTTLASSNGPSNSSAQMAENEERKRVIAAQMREKAAAAARKQAEQQVSQNTVKLTPQVNITAQQKPKSEYMHQHQQLSVKPMSPMETYEMSDRGESSDSSDDEERAKKKIPSWAQKSKLIPALEKQFLDGPDRLDPDEIFPEVSTCDLQEIFDQKKKRYAKRTSSGNWTKDRVTATEKLVYKRAMGFKK